MRHARKIGMPAVLGLACLSVGCSAATPVTSVRSHAELTREAMLDRDANLFAVGDAIGARMLRKPGQEGEIAPVFARTTPQGFQAADAIGAVALSGRAAVATVMDDE